jgi:hypothetical protein
MYAVVCYFNYRKDVSFSILKTFYSFENADKYALKCAKDDFGDNVEKGVSQQWVDVDDKIDGYTTGDGYGEFVYTVMYIPEPKDTPHKSKNTIKSNIEHTIKHTIENTIENEIDEKTQMEFKKQKNEKYEWGFDLTDFNEEEEDDEDENDEKENKEEKENKGAIKFKHLLDKFDLKSHGEGEGGFLWKNEKIMLVTCNNPLSGVYYLGNRHNEKGYLSYVGVSCEDLKDLKDFIKEFRSKATYIKEEANGRIYI